MSNLTSLFYLHLAFSSSSSSSCPGREKKKMGLTISSRDIMVFVVFILVLSEMGAAADNGESSCISSLVPCANYINATTKPPSECCEPLLNVINTQQQCLCNLLNSDLIKQSSFNITQALKLPALCGGKNATTDACKNGTATASTPSPPASTTTTGSESTNTSSAEAVSVEILLPLVAFFFLGVSV